MRITDSFHLAEIGHLPAINKMAKEFFLASPYTIFTYDAKRINDQLAFMFLDRHNYLVGVSVDEDKTVGMIIAQKIMPTFSSEYVGAEIAWWLDKEYHNSRRGIELIEAYEQWGRLTGCRALQTSMLVTSPPSVEKLYYSRGYAKTETGFQKVLV